MVLYLPVDRVQIDLALQEARQFDVDKPAEFGLSDPSPLRAAEDMPPEEPDAEAQEYGTTGESEGQQIPVRLKFPQYGQMSFAVNLIRSGNAVLEINTARNGHFVGVIPDDDPGIVVNVLLSRPKV